MNIDKDIEIEKRLEKSINVIEEMIIKSRDLREEEFYKLIGIKQIQAIADIVTLLDKRCKKINELKEELETKDKIIFETKKYLENMTKSSIRDKDGYYLGNWYVLQPYELEDVIDILKGKENDE